VSGGVDVGGCVGWAGRWGKVAVHPSQSVSLLSVVTSHNLVHDQKDAVFVAKCSHALHVVGRVLETSASTHQRLHHDLDRAKDVRVNEKDGNDDGNDELTTMMMTMMLTTTKIKKCSTI
jgi:hypothetical protein